MPNTTSGLHKFVLTHSARLDGIFFFIYLLTLYRLLVSQPHFSASFFVQCNKICKTGFLAFCIKLFQTDLERFSESGGHDKGRIEIRSNL